MQDNDVKNIYTEHYNRYPDLVADREHPTYIHLMHFLPHDKSAVILDAACGQGKYSMALKECGYQNVYAVDLLEDIPVEGVVYRNCSIENLPQEWSGKFDFIFCNSAIYYLSNPMIGLEEFNRCLKDGGKLFFTAHTKYSTWTLLRKIKLFLGLSSVKHLVNVHFDRDVQEYLQMLDRCGYERIYVSGYDLSMCYAFYERIARALHRRIGVCIPIIQTRVISWKEWGYFKARYAYHSIIVVAKSRDGAISSQND